MDEEMLEMLFPESYSEEKETLSVLNIDSDEEGEYEC